MGAVEDKRRRRAVPDAEAQTWPRDWIPGLLLGTSIGGVLLWWDWTVPGLFLIIPTVPFLLPFLWFAIWERILLPMAEHTLAPVE